MIAFAKRIRSKHPETGLVLFSYYNVIFSKGLANFAAAVEDAQIDAVLAVDLPLEEREELLRELRPRGISFVPLIAPNTPLERIKASEAGLDDSFLYVITVKAQLAREPNCRAISRPGWTPYARRRICPWPQDSAFRLWRKPARSHATQTASS